MSKVGAHVRPGSRNGYGPFTAAKPAVVIAVDEGGALLKPCPCPASHNGTNAGAVNPENGRDFILCLPAHYHLPDLCNPLFGQLGVAVFASPVVNSKPINCVSGIFPAGYILQVAKTVIHLIAVFMVYLFARWRVARKRFHYKVVYRFLLQYTKHNQGDLNVAVSVSDRAKNLSREVLFSTIYKGGYPIQASNSTLAAYPIKTLVPNYISPLFFHGDTFPCNRKPPRKRLESVTKPTQSAGAFNDCISGWFGDKVNYTRGATQCHD